MKFEDLSQAFIHDPSGLSEDEMEQMEQAYQDFEKVVETYKFLIENEIDSHRIIQLKVLLSLYMEDNK